MNWRLNGAGDDPVAFYAEVEPRVVAMAEEYRNARPSAKTRDELKDLRDSFKARMSPLVGAKKASDDCEAVIRKLPDGLDSGGGGVRLLVAALPKPGDIRNRLYHQGAAVTIMDSIDEALGL